MFKELADVLSFRGRRDGDQFLQAIVEQTPECIKIVGPDGRLLRMNAAGLHMIEADTWAIVDGASTPGLIAEETRDHWLEHHRRVCGGEKLCWQFDIVGLHGTRRHMETHAVPIELQDGTVGQLAITRDIGARKKAEEDLLRANSELGEVLRERTRALEETTNRLGDSERVFSLLVSSVVDYAIYMLDLNGMVVSWNAGAERIKGYSGGEIIGQNFSRFYTEEDRDRGLPQKGLATAKQEGRFESEGWRVRKDGTRFWASVVIDAVRDGGEIIGFAKVTRDITDKKASDERLRQAERLQAIGQFTGGAAHDFNNLLMAISGSLQLLRKRVRDDDRSRALLDNAIEAAERGAGLTQRMLAFARRQELSTEVIDVYNMTRGMSQLIRQTIGAGIDLKLTVPKGMSVKTDVIQLESALLNLVVNARDAMPDGGIIAIDARMAEIVSPYEGLSPGQFVIISVTDTGAGMDDKVLAQAREPFFTTKGVGKGTGLGLSTVDGLVAQSNGKLLITSEVGRGTTVEIWLPAEKSEQSDDFAPTFPVACAPDRPQRKLRVLAVDDDALVLMNTVGMLEELGHEVLDAYSGPVALDRLDAEGPIDLVITDQGMPGMTGLQLAEAVRARNPKISVIVATGYSELPTTALALKRLSKPFSLDQLEAAILSVG